VKREFVDKELGLFFVTENIRARRLTFRTKNDVIYVTVPFGTSVGELKDAIEKLRSKLKMARVNQARAFIDLNFKIEADLFKLDLAVGERKRFLSHTDAGHTHIICPPDADFNNAELQNWFHKVILEALRKNAKAVLPPRLSILAQTHGLTYESVSINSSKGRWGSCSARKTINLSCYLLLLPRHLIDYVLLHELSHTREMNHGDGFWSLLDDLTNGNAKMLRNELRQFRINF
jgi:Predicted metal-dependent hydrolase